MKQLLFLFFFVISFGLQFAHAAVIGVPELIILLIVGVVVMAAMVGFIFLCLHLIRRSKPTQDEK